MRYYRTCVKNYVQILTKSDGILVRSHGVEKIGEG